MRGLRVSFLHLLIYYSKGVCEKKERDAENICQICIILDTIKTNPRKYGTHFVRPAVLSEGDEHRLLHSPDVSFFNKTENAVKHHGNDTQDDDGHQHPSTFKSLTSINDQVAKSLTDRY